MARWDTPSRNSPFSEATRWRVPLTTRPTGPVCTPTSRRPTWQSNSLPRLLSLGIPTVCGTTGWYAELDAVAQLCRDFDGTLFTASNFSLGMNIMFDLNERLADLMRGRDAYRVDITEVHHIHKLDAPSGTALVLQDAIRQRLPQQEAPIASVRQGEVPGTHTVRYQSAADTITLCHEAHSRSGLALGAVLAAEFVQGRKGIFTMRDLLRGTPSNAVQ